MTTRLITPALRPTLVLGLFLAALAVPAALPGHAGDLEDLQGTWRVQKTNDQGQPFTQALEFKKDKFVFKIMGAEDTLFLYAEGDFKLEPAGPFKAARFVNIKGGQSAADAQPISEEFAIIYVLSGDTWTVAANFDKERERPPGIDLYKRVKAAEAPTLVIDKIVMEETPQSARWYICFEATADGVTRKFNVPGKGYEKNAVTVTMDLALPKVRTGKPCTFTCKLDDVEEDACTEEVDQRSTGTFTTSASGSQAYKPEDHWRYTVYWHMK